MIWGIEGKEWRKSSGEFMESEIKIMLVEDNIEDATFTERVLKFNKLHKDLVLAASGLEALEALEKCDRESNQPNLILVKAFSASVSFINTDQCYLSTTALGAKVAMGIFNYIYKIMIYLK